jgi:crotonobetainyl-CoA:carnitine CoA-transferase CaiB-like acyl-CoA transferase
VLGALDRPDLAADPRYADAAGRVEHAAELIAELDGAFAARPLAAWADRFDEHDVWWAPVQSIVDVIADPQAQTGFVAMTPRDGDAPFRAVATPVDFDGYTVRPGPVPTLGEHTAEVLEEMRRIR